MLEFTYKLNYWLLNSLMPLLWTIFSSSNTFVVDCLFDLFLWFGVLGVYTGWVLLDIAAVVARCCCCCTVFIGICSFVTYYLELICYNSFLLLVFSNDPDKTLVLPVRGLLFWGDSWNVICPRSVWKKLFASPSKLLSRSVTLLILLRLILVWCFCTLLRLLINYGSFSLLTLLVLNLNCCFEGSSSMSLPSELDASLSNTKFDRGVLLPLLSGIFFMAFAKEWEISFARNRGL